MGDPPRGMVPSRALTAQGLRDGWDLRTALLVQIRLQARSSAVGENRGHQARRL